MPRQHFTQDLQVASSPGKYAHLADVRAGEDDGTVSFTFSHELTGDIQLQALISDISSYPHHHGYLVYTTSEDVLPAFSDALQESQKLLLGLSIQEMLGALETLVSNHLSSSGSMSDTEMMDIIGDTSENQEDEEDEGDALYEFESDGSEYGLSPSVGNGPYISPSSRFDATLFQSIQDDLRLAKEAGFKIGLPDHLNTSSSSLIVSVSCLIARLGISEEAMRAWSVQPQQYLVLLIRYRRGYQTLKQVFAEDKTAGKTDVTFHVSLCDSYKPTRCEAVRVLNLQTPSHIPKPEKVKLENGEESGSDQKSRQLVPCFIGQALNGLLNDRLVKIARYRHTYGFSWTGAEVFYNDLQGKALNTMDLENEKYHIPEHVASTSTFPELVTADHMSNGKSDTTSFPLISMQFVLRHFVRCTEFCLVCHCKTNASFEALKPYVCSNGLCLYQYMALGFGPRVEWEVLTQPYVVDLLVSFTYASAQAGRLDDFPQGLGIMVPVLQTANTVPLMQYQGEGRRDSGPPCGNSSVFVAKYNQLMRELIVSGHMDVSLHAGDWIVIQDAQGLANRHCRVEDTSSWPMVKVASQVGPPTLLPDNTSSHKPISIPVLEDVKFMVYDQNFDSLNEGQKQATICMLLDTLPSVHEMREFLMQSGTSAAEYSLPEWRDRISNAAMDLLRWIIASNRSCILQANPSNPWATAGDATSIVNQDLVGGMSGLMQFRFAQGAPDKEQRFIESLKLAEKLEYPSIWTWHGSPLFNWHGIVREGLNFKHVLHGRSCGHGVYMAADYQTSTGYMSHCGTGRCWPNSVLKISGAIQLNEVVNLRKKFTYNHHRVIVVSQVDWIQARYLFVQCGGGQALPTYTQPAEIVPQDPGFSATGSQGPLVIPISAISSRRGIVSVAPATGSQNKMTRATKGGKGKAKGKGRGKEEARKTIPIVEICDDDTDDEDRALLLSPQSEGGRGSQSPKTDFVPGQLLGTSLPLMAVPSYATPSATKVLQRDLLATLQVQERCPAHELGWYIDPNLITTPYQWIVEMHSFDPELSLSKQMKTLGIQSIVLEMRFPKDHPIAPPFVRVIRPRFLPFLQGGGGHVTAGGALCMELLTNTGWSAASTIESVLLQVRLALSSTEPFPAQLDSSQGKGRVKDYAVGEAVQAFIRACRTHGWEVPRDFERMSTKGWKPAGAA